MTDFVPKEGDHVTVKGLTGVYLVYRIDASIRVAELMERRSGLRLSTIPWDSLTSVYEVGTPVNGPTRCVSYRT
jgi:hypothetical protein